LSVIHFITFEQSSGLPQRNQKESPPQMKIVTRYLLKELTIPFLLGILVFTFVLLFGQFLELMDLIVNQGIDPGSLILFTLLGIPETFILTVPMAMVLATLMAYGRLSCDQEIIIFRLSGFPLRKLLLPTLVLGFVLSIGLLAFRQYVAPPLSEYKQEMMQSLSQPDPARIMKEKTYQTFGDFTLFAEHVNGLKLRNVHIEDRRNKPPRDIYSDRGRWLEEDDRYRLVLHDGTIYQRGENRSEYRVLSFRETTLTFEPDNSGNTGDQPTRTLTQLWEEVQQARTNRLDLLLEKRRNGSQEMLDKKLKQAERMLKRKSVDFHRAISFPLATFCLVLIAAPIGILCREEGKSAGFAISLGIILAYYLLTTFSEPLAVNGWLSPWLAMWSANLLFGGIGIILLGRLAWKGG